MPAIDQLLSDPGFSDTSSAANRKDPTFRPIPAEEEGYEPLIPRRITKREILYFTNELSVMVGTGISLSVALGSIAEQAENPSLRKLVDELKTAVESGDDFSAALGRHPKVFDKTYIHLVRASEVSGALSRMLERIVDQGRMELESRAKVRAALAYPMVMMLASVLASTFLLVYVFPKFTPLFAGRGMALPVPTRIMIGISDVLVQQWYFIVGGLFATSVAGFWFFNQEFGLRILHHLKLNIPILGPMFRKVAISRSIRTLGTMLNSGVPTLQALRLSGEVSGNMLYEKVWHQVADGVTEGKEIHQMLILSKLFPRSLVQMISAGEQSGQLGKVLDRVSDYYDRELETAIKAATSLIEPIMVCVMGVVVGSVAMALMLPIFTLSHNMG